MKKRAGRAKAFLRSDILIRSPARFIDRFRRSYRVIRLPAKPIGRFQRSNRRKSAKSIGRFRRSNQRKNKGAAFLTDDLIGDILIRLPAKSIGRFRCVCKRFLSLTSQPNFIKEHASRAPISGFFCTSYVQHIFMDSRPYSLPYPCKPLSIESSCNGLLLLRQDRKKRDRFLLFNPITNKSWPAISPSHNIHHLCLATLHFDPSCSLDFKVAGFVEQSIVIFSSRTQTWKTTARLDAYPDYLRTEGGSCNGRIFWETDRNNGGYGYLFWFDIESEKFGRVKLPRTGILRRVGASGGVIHIVDSFRIWLLMPDFSGWSKLCSINPLDMARGLPSDACLYFRPRIVHFHKGNEKEGDIVFFGVRDNIFSYHLQSRISVHVTRAKQNKGYMCNEKIFPHAETIISPDQISNNISSELATPMKTPPPLGTVHRDTIRVQVSRHFLMNGQPIPYWVWILGGDTEFLHIDTAKLHIIRLYTDIEQPIPEWVWTMSADGRSMA